MSDPDRPSAWKLLLAFAAIYFIWGSTFLAIRKGVLEIPPLLFASMRFTAAGLALLAFARTRQEPMPRPAEWRSAALLAVLIFVFDYGLLFWAEQRVPSGRSAVMMATIPVFMVIFEALLLRTLRLTPTLIAALAIGLLGVAILVSRSLHFRGAPIDRTGALALIVASLSWSLASVLTRKLPLPSSKIMNSGVQMLLGGVFLALAAVALGEFRHFHPATVSPAAWLSLAYLIVAGSIVGFTAYIWLIHHESPTRVGTYAYVNPLVAVVLGHFLAGEVLDARTLAGTASILISVVLITTLRK